MVRELMVPPASPQDLAFALAHLDLGTPLVVALPRGLMTACRIAHALGAPIDVLVGFGAEASPMLSPGEVDDYRALRLKGRAVVLTDDGDAELSSWTAALQALRAMRPETLVIAAPRLQPAVARWLAGQIDNIVGPLQALAA